MLKLTNEYSMGPKHVRMYESLTPLLLNFRSVLEKVVTLIIFELLEISSVCINLIACLKDNG